MAKKKTPAKKPNSRKTKTKEKASTKKRGGRPSKSDYIEANSEKIIELAKNGYTDEEICKFIGVSKSVFYAYKNKFSEFSELIGNAKSKADNEVINALYKRATGYEYEEKTTEYVPLLEGDKSKAKVKIVKCAKKHVVPDVKACDIWLSRRMSDRWGDKSRLVLENPDGTALFQNFNFLPTDGNG